MVQHRATSPDDGNPASIATEDDVGAGAALLAVTGAAGFLLTPSRRIAVNVVGGLGTAAIGNIGRKRLTDERQKAAVPAVARLARRSSELAARRAPRPWRRAAALQLPNFLSASRRTRCSLAV